MKALLILVLLVPFITLAETYPREWWVEVPRSEAASWEILPQDAKSGEVILSKRTELGIFSNFGATPFILDGKRFASVEGLWQSIKYPDPAISNDSRFQIKQWAFTRAEVENMIGTDAKNAGNLANKIYSQFNLKFVNWGEHFFDYVDHAEGSAYHYDLIKRALRAKLDQTPGLWNLLLKTGCLTLKPDHKAGANEPASYRYYEIYMELRSERQTDCH
ncbi:NADAR family protein [Peredibacter starrii]|uniref:Uncharacterized protein n=1 Tax=Peredibacter starrii TaxID=28202 RepID=A0AAX4HL10_9BACT|nr:hypothetical protein [Peredibacter starrii]WPU63886.1 hypothetical protein SOO65_14420 [Peredibacter starrii]